jgi:hypothetical protein
MNFKMPKENVSINFFEENTFLFHTTMEPEGNFGALRLFRLPVDTFLNDPDILSILSLQVCY